MNTFARIVVGYHGCEKGFADKVLSGELPLLEWRPSNSPSEWLGKGIYFWEYGLIRARDWAVDLKEPAVIGALIQLGDCLDLSDIRYHRFLNQQYTMVAEEYKVAKKELPLNTGSKYNLDCLILNNFVERMNFKIQTVRCPYLQGGPLFPGSSIRSHSHIQIAVRDTSCILGVFRPTTQF